MEEKREVDTNREQSVSFNGMAQDLQASSLKKPLL